MSSPVGRVLRSVSQVALGVVVGAVLVGPVMAATQPKAPSPAAIHTRAASCAGYNFQTIDHETKQGYDGTEVYRSDSGGEGFFVCHPDLPHRAVVTKVQFTVADRYTGNARHCGLYRTDLKATSSGAAQELARVADTSMPDGGGVRRLTDPTIQRATIDNTRYGYWLQCQLNATGSISTAPPNAGLRGATVTYQISSANG